MSDASLTAMTPSGWDIAVEGADLASSGGLRSAVIVSLFTDRRAEEDDALPDPDDRWDADRRGWWADAYAAGEDLHGSRLWLLRRAKETPDTLYRARTYAQESLQWLLDDGIATTVEVSSQWAGQAPGRLELRVSAALADGGLYEEEFGYAV